MKIVDARPLSNQETDLINKSTTLLIPPVYAELLSKPTHFVVDDGRCKEQGVWAPPTEATAEKVPGIVKLARLLINNREVSRLFTEKETIMSAILEVLPSAIEMNSSPDPDVVAELNNISNPSFPLGSLRCAAYSILKFMSMETKNNQGSNGG